MLLGHLHVIQVREAVWLCYLRDGLTTDSRSANLPHIDIVELSGKFHHRSELSHWSIHQRG
jgi:hypothetical protein